MQHVPEGGGVRRILRGLAVGLGFLVVLFAGSIIIGLAIAALVLAWGGVAWH